MCYRHDCRDYEVPNIVVYSIVQFKSLRMRDFFNYGKDQYRDYHASDSRMLYFVCSVHSFDSSRFSLTAYVLCSGAVVCVVGMYMCVRVHVCVDF
jgi:hypothetical protein